LSVGTVVLGVLGFNAAARRLGPLNTMLMLNLVPVGVFGIEAALGRSFEAVELAGAATVIAALVANNLYLRRRVA
jgi:drug/metabolite transporter (DMT)-like permease